MTYNRYIRQFVEEHGLLENPQFVAFITDIVLNTSDATAPNILPTLVRDSLGRKQYKEEDEHQIQLPVLDRFMNLLMTLDNPGWFKALDAQANVFRTEFGLTNELNSADRALGFRASNDPEYLLKYQIVALAKFHNYFGKMDEYMKEFANVCQQMKDKPHIARNLERLLNAEISIGKPSTKKLLERYKTLPREIDPMVLA